jgi:uncharacterized protein
MRAELTVRTHSSLADIGRQNWDRLANPGWTDDLKLSPTSSSLGESSACANDSIFGYNPFVSYDFLSSCEDSGCVCDATGWRVSHLAVEDGRGNLIGAVPGYVKSHSMGEYVFDHGWADAYERAGGRYYPKLQVAVPFTPATGPRLLTDQPDKRSALVAALSQVIRKAGLSSAHITFAGETDIAAAAAGGWLVRYDLQYHFENAGYQSYDEFLAQLSSRKRKALKRERRDALAAGISIKWLTGADLTEAHWDAFYAFYQDTGSRKWGRPYLNRRFFSLISERMADRILLVMAFRGGRAIAGALNFIGSDRLYGRNWGAIEEHPFLHFEVCYHQAIDYAIAHGLKVVEAGAQGEHKIARGYMPVITRSAHDIVDPGFRRAVEGFLVRERQGILASAEALGASSPFKEI